MAINPGHFPHAQKSGMCAVGIAGPEPKKNGFSAQIASGQSPIRRRYVTRPDHGVVKTPGSSTVIGERRKDCNVLGNAIGEIVLLRVAAEIAEGRHCDGGPIK
jgi:hypothetical protein